MAKLIYTALTSLDGYIEDEEGRFDWAVPDVEVHEFCNDLQRSIGTHLYGRRMYEVMATWETVGGGPEVSTAESDFAEVWRRLDKIVYSRRLGSVTTTRTRLERNFDAETVRHVKDAADQDLSISGPGLAQYAFQAGLVDEVHHFVFPVIVGGGKPALPAGVRVDLELIAMRQFANGVVHLHHRTR